MAKEMEFTGERFTPECEREIWYEHVHRYAFASHFCSQAEVLDAACGEGYGSALLARYATGVTGVDISPEAIEHAAARYSGQGNLSFQAGDCSDLPFESGRFDVVVSFETLEHLEAQESMLAEFRRVLKPQGLLILSSPDKAEYSDRQNFENPFHVRELYRSELETLISRSFPACRILGQRLMFHSVIYDQGKAGRLEVQTALGNAELASGRLVHAPMYFIALCAGSEELLPAAAAGVWLFDDADDTVYRHYQHEIRKNMQAGGVLARHQARIKELEQELTRRPTPWWQRWIKGG